MPLATLVDQLGQGVEGWTKLHATLCQGLQRRKIHQFVLETDHVAAARQRLNRFRAAQCARHPAVGLTYARVVAAGTLHRELNAQLARRHGQHLRQLPRTNDAHPLEGQGSSSSGISRSNHW